MSPNFRLARHNKMTYDTACVLFVDSAQLRSYLAHDSATPRAMPPAAHVN